MTQEQLEAALTEGAQRAERLVDTILGGLEANGAMLSQERLLGEAFMFAAVSAAMHGMSRRLSGLSRVRSDTRRRMEKQARVLGHQLIAHVKFEQLEPPHGEASEPPQGG